MKTLVIVLTLFSFLQATILPLDLGLIIIILRAYIKDDVSNLYLAFFVGLILSHLEVMPFGILSLVYLLAVQATRMLSKSRLSEHIITVIPLIFIILAVKDLILGHEIRPYILIESVLALPIYIALRFWEERFVVKDIKLRI